MDIDTLRKQIDQLDCDLVRLLNERTKVVLNIGKLKKDQEGEIYVPAREQEVFKKVETLNDGPLPDEALKAVYASCRLHPDGCGDEYPRGGATFLAHDSLRRPYRSRSIADRTVASGAPCLAQRLTAPQ